jgi:hypothetical protein
VNPILKRFCLIVLAVVTTAAIANAIWIANLRSEFEERLAALRAGGMPVEVTDFRKPPIPSEDNAAPLLLEARSMIEAVTEPELAFDELTLRYDEEKRDEVSAYLERLEPCVPLLREAAARPSCRFDTNWEAGIAAKVEDIPCMQAATRFLDLQVRWSCRYEVAPDRSVEDAHTTWRIAGHLGDTALISELVAATAQAVACGMLERLANHPGVDAIALQARFDPLLAEADEPRRWIRTLESERCLGLWLVFRWLDGDSPMYWLKWADQITSGVDEPEIETRWYDPLLGSWIGRGLAYREGLRLLDFYEEAISIARPGEVDAIDTLSDLHKRTRKTRIGLAHFVSRIPMQMLHESVLTTTRLRVARTGLAVAAYHARYGAWPRSLAELDGPELIDPYSGEALRYEITDEGVEIESRRPVPMTDYGPWEDARIIWRLTG